MSLCSLTEVDRIEVSSGSSSTAAERVAPRTRTTIDLNANFEARIENPLAGVPPRRLLLAVDEFCHEKHLEDYRQVIRKGALVARDPTAYEDITGTEALDPTEIEVLREEVLHKWRITRVLLLTFITCSIGAAVHGWDQTTSNGATLGFPTAFGIDGEDDRSKWLVGLVNAAPYISTSLLGCWLSDPLNDAIGRRGTIFIAANFSLWPVIASAFCHTWQQLLACRLLLGLGMGAKASTIPIYAAENSPAPIRGAFVMSWQLWTAFGILLGTCSNFSVFSLGWRYQLAAAGIPAVPLCILIYFCPESPRWYMKKNRYVDAMKCLLRLRKHPIQAGRDLYYIHIQLELEDQFIKRGRGNYIKKFAELFYIPRLRRASLAAFTVMIAQQMCGINIIAFYSTTVFKDAGFSEFNALLASCGFGFVNFVFAFPAIWCIDTFGRRSLLLSTFPLMVLALLGAGLGSLIPGDSSAHLGLVALFVYLFAAFYSPGEGPIPFTYSAEVFPLSHRELGMAFAVATCKFWASVLSLTFPLMLERLKAVGSFFTYAGFNVAALVMIFFFVPETKQRTLEELDYIFAVPTTMFIKYQVVTALPWWFKRWVLWQKDATLPPLYQLDCAEVSEPEVVESIPFEYDKARIEVKYQAALDNAQTQPGIDQR